MWSKISIIKFVVITALICRSQAILITSPLPNSNIVAGSAGIITWTETSIPRFDIQLLKYNTFMHDNYTVEKLASNIDSNSRSHSIIFPLKLTTKPRLYKLVITHGYSTLASVGPLKFISPVVKAKDTPTASTLQHPSSIFATPLLIAPIKTLNTNNPNTTEQLVNTTIEENNNVYKDYDGFTVSSGQVAGVSMCIVAVSSFLIWVYIFLKSYIDERHAARELIISSDSEDSVSQIPTEPNKRSSVPDMLNSSSLENIIEEDSLYEKMFYSQQYTEGYKDGMYYHLTPTSGQRSTSTIQRISTDDNVFGQSFQNMNEFYADLPLPAKPLYSSRSPLN